MSETTLSIKCQERVRWITSNPDCVGNDYTIAGEITEDGNWFRHTVYFDKPSRQVTPSEWLEAKDTILAVLFKKEPK